MKVIRSAIPDVLILEPKVYGDERGFFSSGAFPPPFGKGGALSDRGGLYHLTATGWNSWHGFTKATLESMSLQGAHS